MIQVCVDGSFRNGKGSIAVIAYRDKRRILTFGRAVKVKNNNEAEFLAVLAALKALKSKKNLEIILLSDSKAVMTELTEHRDSKVKKLNEYTKRIFKEAEAFKKLKFRWAARGQTLEANNIAKEITKKDK